MFVESGAKPERDIFSLDNLISWLETQPANRKYEYNNCFKCLLGQYFTAMECGTIWVGHRKIHLGATSFNMPEGWYYIASGTEKYPLFFQDTEKYPLFFQDLDGNRAEWTFGKALARAKAIKEKRNISSPKPVTADRLATVSAH